MKTPEIKEWTDIIESLVKTSGIIVGAIWVYLKFIRTRENYPKIQFELDLRFLSRHDDKIVIEAICNIENKGLVRHHINDLSCNILILRKDDKLGHGDERINHQLLFEKYNVPENSNERIVLIPKDWLYSFIDGGIKQQYTYLTDIPANTELVSVFAKFYFRDRDSDFQTAQKTFSITQIEKDCK